MSSGLTRPFARAAAALVLFAALPARSALDTFVLGDGSDGAIDLNTTDLTQTTFAGVTANIAAGATTVAVNTTTGFGAQDLVLLIRVTGLASATSGDQTTVAFTG